MHRDNKRQCLLHPEIPRCTSAIATERIPEMQPLELSCLAGISQRIIAHNRNFSISHAKYMRVANHSFLKDKDLKARKAVPLVITLAIHSHM